MKAKLILVGDGPEMSLAEHMIAQHGLTDDVLLLGNQDSIATILPVADLFMLPSQTESFGLAALEAMACGVLVLASDTGGLPELVTNGQDGYLVPVGDVAGMVEKATSILSDDQRLREMKKAARQTAVERFSEELLVPRYEEYYLRVIAGKGNGN
jgi:N-acetyl-alpha-D-glucosaminyl L-malate synthase BshA